MLPEDFYFVEVADVFEACFNESCTLGKRVLTKPKRSVFKVRIDEIAKETTIRNTEKPARRNKTKRTDQKSQKHYG